MSRTGRQAGAIVVIDRLAAWVRGLIFVLTAVMLASLVLQVGMRYLVGQALSWTEEVALACFSWAILLAVALGVRDSIHVRMDLLVDALPAGARRAVERLICIAVAALGAFLAWAGVRYVLDTQGITSAATGYPIGWLYSAAPVCGALIFVFALENAWRVRVDDARDGARP